MAASPSLGDAAILPLRRATAAIIKQEYSTVSACGIDGCQATEHDPMMWTNSEEQRRASDRYENALRQGRIARGDTCELCGQKGKMHGHHWHGYSSAHVLDVQWLCLQCHHRVHTGIAGGRSRMTTMTAEERSRIARLGGMAVASKLGSAHMAALAAKGGGRRYLMSLTPEQRSTLGRRAVLTRNERRRVATVMAVAATASFVASLA